MVLLKVSLFNQISMLVYSVCVCVCMFVCVCKQIVISMGSCLNDAGTGSSAFSQLTMDSNKNIILQLEKAVFFSKVQLNPKN